MSITHSLLALGTLALLSAAPALAQQNGLASSSDTGRAEQSTSPTRPVAAATVDSAPPAAAPIANVFRKTVDRVRPYDQRGINMFEAPKQSSKTFTGPTLDIGAAFTQQYQGLTHENTADPRMVGDRNRNRLIDMGAGFNLAAANLAVNAQLSRGIVVVLENYMSSRGHNEFYVKGGYLQIDESPIDVPVLQKIMEYTTLKIGHFENNYGDAHFRRTDNGQAMYNPFVGNYIVDAFTTELGGEVYLRRGPWMAMGGLTSGEVKGAVADPDKRGWARYGKLGYDRQLNQDLRVRLTGSLYKADKSLNQTLFSGDRAGSRYYEVLVDSVGRDRWSGSIQPGFRNSVTAFQINPFVKFRGLELFGVIEQGEGRSAAEATDRKMTQYAGDVVYRFAGDRLYVGGRYNAVTAELAGMADEVSVDRAQLGGGWFISPLVLLKGEYVNQKYNDFPTTDIRNGGRFKGFVVEGVVAF